MNTPAHHPRLRPLLMALSLAALGFNPATAIAQQNAIRSCYDIAHMPVQPSPAGKALFVAIDQTTPLNDNLKHAVADNIKHLRRPGLSFNIVRFSAYTQGYYTEVLAAGRLDPLPTQNERDDISKPMLASFDNCIKYQVPYADRLIAQALQKGFAGASGNIAKSDVLASLKEISTLVRNSASSEKSLLIVSDMLENSSVTSFYANQSVRPLDVQRELKLASDAQLLGDFGGAKIYVIGGGLLDDSNEKAKNTYRDPKTMRTLADFWRGYFQRSNAELIEFGQPALLSLIQ